MNWLEVAQPKLYESFDLPITMLVNISGVYPIWQVMALGPLPKGRKIYGGMGSSNLLGLKLSGSWK